MRILAIDTSTRTGSAALLRDTEIIAEVSGYEESTLLFPCLFRDVALLQDRAGFRISEIDVFAVSAGPGSFTGLRVGLAAVKAWAEVHGKPIAAISGLEAIASECPGGGTVAASSAAFLAPFLDGRRGQIFGAIYRKRSRTMAWGSRWTATNPFCPWRGVSALLKKPTGLVQLVSPTPEVLPADLLREILGEAQTIPVSAALAPAIGRLGFKRAQRGELIDALRLDANYVRRSDAESKWKHE